DRHHLYYGFYQLFVRSKGRSNHRGKQNHQQDQNEIEQKHKGHHYFEAFLHSFSVSMTIIITYDGYESQCEASKGNTDKKHGTLHDCQCTHIDITECLQ